ncbi:MAG: methionine adenosyltransferase [Paludibacteraceae bacterium]|nr:methionine adenosyltransferase [Paludibacteraceae bacterium]
MYLFTSESVSEGHPDKVADQISDALLDNFLAQDASSKVACETLVTTGQVVVAGEVKSNAYVDIQSVARGVINRIGYTKSDYMFAGDSCGIFSALHEQSGDINRGVERTDPMDQGAGDQGIMFGYACNETRSCMPLALDMSHALLRELAAIRREGRQMTYLRPDAKSQVTIIYDDHHKAVGVDTIVVSTQHDEFISPSGSLSQAEADGQMLQQICQDVKNLLIPRVIDRHPEYADLLRTDYKLLVNPTGKFVIGGPHGDTGLTGRKIVVDSYGGYCAHGGGAFSGKDPSKVDRSAAYAARHLAKNLVAAGVADQVTVQLSYAIGVARPVSIFLDTHGTAHVDLTDQAIIERVSPLFDMRPYAIEQRLKLRNPIYEETAAYGHFGREPQTVVKHFRDGNGHVIDREVELFTWEKLDYVGQIRQTLNL